MQAQGTTSSISDAENFRVQSLFSTADMIHDILEGCKGANSIAEVLGKYPNNIFIEGSRTALRMVPRVRRLTEHIKVLDHFGV